ncbi:MAG: hypothetical protein ACRD2S_00800 [Terriglobales bacterium]
MSFRGSILKFSTLLAITFTFAQIQTATAASNQSVQKLNRVGTTIIKAGPLGSGAFQLPEIFNEDDSVGLKGNAAVAPGAAGVSFLNRRSNLAIPSKVAGRQALISNSALASQAAAASTLPLKEPTAHSSAVIDDFQDTGFIGFDGLSNIDQRTANNGNQYSLEPPDQGLCAGNGFVVEAVNDVIQVYDRVGNPLTGAEDMNSFFGLAPAIIRGNPNIVGPFLSDPRCYYDAQTKRWFVTELEEDSGNNTGATGRDYNLIAVSQTSDPTAGFAVFQYDNTDDGLNGTPNHGGCPCFGDQPLLGADKYGIYQTTNEFGATTFNGAQIYAISKAQLVAAANSLDSVAVIQIDASGELVPFGGESYSIQPAQSPSPTAWEAADNGVEYFLSALQFGNPGYEEYDNRIAVWALTNTKTLNSNFPVLNLSFNIVHTETYGQPDPAVQKPGPTPLATSLGDPEELINTNDDRMNQVILSNGILYGELNSKLKVGGASQTGAAWFAVQPAFSGPNLSGSVFEQGYIAVAKNNVIFPAVGVDRDNDGAIVFTLVGPDYFPSVAYTSLTDSTVAPLIHVAGEGVAPDDGFTGYPQEGGNGVGRWGDYSAATWDGERIWFASEYIPQDCGVNAPPCREVLFNWGTFVGSIKP